MCVCACVYRQRQNTPDYLFGETVVDSVDVLLQRGARFSLDLLHFFQPPAGHEQTASLTVVRQHLLERGETRYRYEITKTRENRHSLSVAEVHSLTDLAELAHYMFEDVAWSVVEERLQTWQVGALLQDTLQSLLTLRRKRKGQKLNILRSYKPFQILFYQLIWDLRFNFSIFYFKKILNYFNTC